MQLLAAVEADGSAPLVETLIHDRRAAAPRHDRGHHHALARPGLGPAARGAPHARRRLRRRDPRRAAYAKFAVDAEATANGEPAPVDVEADELAAKRTRALRHALAEYELRSYVITPGRPLGEILAR